MEIDDVYTNWLIYLSGYCHPDVINFSVPGGLMKGVKQTSFYSVNGSFAFTTDTLRFVYSIRGGYLFGNEGIDTVIQIGKCSKI